MVNYLPGHSKTFVEYEGFQSGVCEIDEREGFDELTKVMRRTDMNH